MRSHKRHPKHAWALFAILATVAICGCGQRNNEVDDPQLKPIQAMIQQSLPIGTTQASVLEFISARGYPTEPSKTGTIVTVIRHIDTQRLQPVTARVTFYFDANGKLNTYQIARTANAPIPQ